MTRALGSKSSVHFYNTNGKKMVSVVVLDGNDGGMVVIA